MTEEERIYNEIATAEGIYPVTPWLNSDRHIRACVAALRAERARAEVTRNAHECCKRSWEECNPYTEEHGVPFGPDIARIWKTRALAAESEVAGLKAEREETLCALEDGHATDDCETLSPADRVQRLYEDRDFYQQAWSDVLTALYPRHELDDEFDPPEVAADVRAIRKELAEANRNVTLLSADCDRLRRELDDERGEIR